MTPFLNSRIFINSCLGVNGFYSGIIYECIVSASLAFLSMLGVLVLQHPACLYRLLHSDASNWNLLRIQIRCDALKQISSWGILFAYFALYYTIKGPSRLSQTKRTDIFIFVMFYSLCSICLCTSFSPIPLSPSFSSHQESFNIVGHLVLSTIPLSCRQWGAACYSVSNTISWAINRLKPLCSSCRIHLAASAGYLEIPGLCWPPLLLIKSKLCDTRLQICDSGHLTSDIKSVTNSWSGCIQTQYYAVFSDLCIFLELDYHFVPIHTNALIPVSIPQKASHSSDMHGDWGTFS